MNRILALIALSLFMINIRNEHDINELIDNFRCKHTLKIFLITFLIILAMAYDITILLSIALLSIETYLVIKNKDECKAEITKFKIKCNN